MRSAHRLIWLPLFLASAFGLGTLVGCSNGKADVTLDGFVKKVFEPRRTPQQQMLIAVSDSDADIRRSAVVKVADSKQRNADWAVKGLVAIALYETDSQTRCVAVRSLGQSGDPRAAEAFLKIMNFRDYPPQEVRPPDDVCRWDVVLGLGRLSGQGVVPEESRATAEETLRNALKRDSSWHVRAAAAAGLANFPTDDSVRGLLAGLRDENFTVAYECDRSLTALSGDAHGCSTIGWDDWYAANEASLFAKRGTVPPEKLPPYTTKIGKFTYDTRQFFWWMFPGKKE